MSFFKFLEFFSRSEVGAMEIVFELVLRILFVFGTFFSSSMSMFFAAGALLFKSTLDLRDEKDFVECFGFGEAFFFFRECSVLEFS